MRQKAKTAMLVSLLTALSGYRAAAQTLINSSFEAPSTGYYIDKNSSQINNPSDPNFWGWGFFLGNSGDPDVGVQTNLNCKVTNAEDGTTQSGWVNGGGSYLYQDLGTLAPTTTYLITAAVASPGGSAYGGIGSGSAAPTVQVNLFNGTNPTSGSNTNLPINGTLLISSGTVTPPAGRFQDVSVSYTTGSIVSNDLILQLIQLTTNFPEQGIFDDVRVSTDGLLPSQQWILNGSGDWNEAANWGNGIIPNAAGAGAEFLDSITTARTIYSDVPVTVGVIRFNNPNSYVLTGAGTLTLQTIGLTNAAIVVQGGATDKISLPLNIASSTTFNVTSGSVLNIAAPMTINPGCSLNHTGGGIVNYTSNITVESGASLALANSAYPHSLTLLGSSLAQIQPHGTTTPIVLQLDSLSIGSGSQLDLANNDLILHSGNIYTTESETAAGYNNGNWNGPGGIVSSSAANDSIHLTALAVIQNTSDGSQTGTALFHTFDGVNVSASDVLVKFTYYGDTNLDGIVDGSDYSRIDTSYLTSATGSATGWYNGDFNYDGVIDGSDYTLIDNSFNMQSCAIEAQIVDPTVGQTDQIAMSGASTAVPEAGSLGLLLAGAISLLYRRRSPIPPRGDGGFFH